MALTTLGKERIASYINGEGLTPFNAANCYVGVGDSSAAFAAGQTDLQASTNKARVAVTSVSRSGAVLTIIAAFGSGVANFQWSEVALFDASTGGLMLAREVAALGTKVSGVWTITLTATVS